MRTMVEAEEQREQEQEGDSEVTLGMSALLAIFFGLVVVCGAFFGFGYSIGHRSHRSAAAADTSSDVAPQPTADASAPARMPKPTANGPLRPAPVSTETAANGAPSQSEESVPASAQRAEAWAQGSSAPAPSPAASASPATIDPRTAPAGTNIRTANAAAPSGAPSIVSPRPTPTYTATGNPASAYSGPASPGSGSMVQVAAISRRPDADALIAALRKRGYPALARTEPQDNLLHVQIGPFSTRAEANTMRQKLLADGYNAIIK